MNVDLKGDWPQCRGTVETVLNDLSETVKEQGKEIKHSQLAAAREAGKWAMVTVVISTVVVEVIRRAFAAGVH